MSYLECTRKTGEGEDGFDIKIKQPVKFVNVTADPGDKTDADTKKTRATNWFWGRHSELASSKFLETCFRLKFERVQSLTKVLKPYAITSCALQLKPGVPIKARTDL